MKNYLYSIELSQDYLYYPIINLLESNKISNVLSIGGGPSLEWIDIVKRFNIKLDIVDINLSITRPFRGKPNYLSFLKDAVNDNDLYDNIRIEECDILDWTGVENKYDLLYARNSLHHIISRTYYENEVMIKDPNSDKIFIKLFRKLSYVLKSGGYFYIRETGRNNYLQYIIPKLKKTVHFPGKTNLEEYIYYLKKTGFNIVEYKYYVPNRLRLLKPLLENKIANKFLTSSFMLLAKKD